MDAHENTTAIAIAMDNATLSYDNVTNGDEGSYSIKRFPYKFYLDFPQADSLLTPFGEDLLEIARLVIMGYCK